MSLFGNMEKDERRVPMPIVVQRRGLRGEGRSSVEQIGRGRRRSGKLGRRGGQQREEEAGEVGSTSWALAAGILRSGRR